MIYQHKLYLSGETRIPFSAGYRLYAWLLQQFPEATAAVLHDQDSRWVSQYLCFDSIQRRNIWTVNIFYDALGEQLARLLVPGGSVKLSEVVLAIDTAAPVVQADVRDFIVRDAETPGTRQTLLLHSPCAFKQAGRYAIVPSEKLILQSIMQQWNAVFPAYTMEDEDAMRALTAGIHITDYQIRTLRYPMKGVKIPGYVGSLTLTASLPAPLMELWMTLLRFAPFSGIGIKTALGMGGVQVKNDG